MTSATVTPTPVRPAPVFVPDSVLDRLAKVSSGSLTTQLYKKGYRQPVLVGLSPLNKRMKPFAAGSASMLKKTSAACVMLQADVARMAASSFR